MIKLNLHIIINSSYFFIYINFKFIETNYYVINKIQYYK